MLIKADSDGLAGVERRGDAGAAHVQALLTGSPVRIDEAGSAEAAGVPLARCKSGRCNLLAYPIAVGQEVIGTVLLANKQDSDHDVTTRGGSCEGGKFNDIDEMLAQDMCAVLAAAFGPAPVTWNLLSSLESGPSPSHGAVVDRHRHRSSTANALDGTVSFL
jgi:hypothetical protein